MQFSLTLALAALATSTSAAVLGAENMSPNSAHVLLPRACGAAGSCHGIGTSTLCNDRCKRCSGPTGAYKRGSCCGFGWQKCCCYYS